MKSTVAFVTLCASAGALAVPLHPVGTPVSAAVAGLLGFVGLRAWGWSRLPSATTDSAVDRFARVFLYVKCIGLGALVGLLLLSVIRLIIEPVVPAAGARIAAAGALPVWRRILIIYVAAIVEELVFRLVLLSTFAGTAARFVRRAPGPPGPRIIWLANGLSALAFGAVHLPSWGAVVRLRPALALVVLALNGIGGLVFGHIFAKRGIVPAMWAHAGADCVIQLLGPLTG